jgi:glycosyltransferase involved in cell wall biosynthesis
LSDFGSYKDRPTVIHYVNGEFTGSTAVAVSLCRPNDSQTFNSLLFLNQKCRSNDAQIKQLKHEGVKVFRQIGRSRPIGLFKTFIRLIKNRPQLLVCHGYSEHIWGRYAAILAGVPNIIHVEHNSREDYSGFRAKELRWLSKRTHKIVACSNDVRIRLLRLGVEENRVVTIENGIDLSLFKECPAVPITQRSKDIIMPARFARQKDQITLIRAVGALRDRGLSLSLTLVGAGDPNLRRRCEQEVKDLGLSSHVLVGDSSKNIPGLLKQHSYCVLSSEYEGYPLVLCEAMAAQCAVVGSRVPGIKNFIRENQDGLMFDFSDAQGLASQLEWLHRHESRAQALANAGRERAERQFGIERMLEQYKEVFDEVLSNEA